MKTFNGLWDKLISFENLYRAYKTASSNGHRTDESVMRFTRNLEENLINLQNELIWHTWTPDPVFEFIVYEPKKRVVQAPSFRDRIVHHAVYQVVGQLFEAKMIQHTFACISQRGPLKAALLLKEYVNEYPNDARLYVIKGDIKSYFPTMNHAYLKELIRRTISDKEVLWLLDKLIEQNGNLVGVGIGALTSQLYAGINLTPFDHYMKDELGIKHYVRYMDDWVIVSDDLEWLKNIMSLATSFLQQCCMLTINPKTRIIPLTHGIDYCGYRIFRYYLLPRKRNMKRARKRIVELVDQYHNGEVELKTVKDSLMSFLGYTKHCKAYRSVQCFLDEVTIAPRDAV